MFGLFLDQEGATEGSVDRSCKENSTIRANTVNSF